MTGIPFASCYVYSPGDHRAASRLLRASVKTGDVWELVSRAIETSGNGPLSLSVAPFFPAAAILVPVPGSRPCASGRPAATGRLALSLLQLGLGRGIWFGLRRVSPVRKSATAPPGARPSAQAHYDTMAVDRIDIPAASHVVLVDDVVTKGRTLLAAARRLRDILPAADIRAFALLRTMGYAPRIGEPLMPCVGTIEWRGGDACRRP